MISAYLATTLCYLKNSYIVFLNLQEIIIKNFFKSNIFFSVFPIYKYIYLPVDLNYAYTIPYPSTLIPGSGLI